MSTETSRIQVIFERAVGLRADERTAFLDEQCAEAPDVRAAVERLIAEHETALGNLDAPTTPMGPPSMEESPDEAPGTVIGRYRLMQQLGEGGFGRVYQAEQLEPVRRQVALKVIKLGMDTRQVIARFEAERQALAMMDHPGIARVFDAGATSTGRPYFVMELVRGVSITAYCDDHRLTTRERLELFVKVCSAVQHAHQKGVIHRDLKPGNILVTMHDGEAIPKVIDFGIAKATSVRLTERTILTEFRQFIGTPEYMSPEQAEMSGLDVDTRADVYSLGVILYELLVGTTPFDSDELRGKGLEALSTMIRETDAPKPSVRFATLGDERAAVARQRGAEADRHGRTLCGDLEWIVMRAIEKSRMRRYQTAASLADDIDRYLRNEPVEAGPPGALYRLSKLARRRRGTLITAAVAIVLVLASVVGLSVGFVRARSAETAQREQLAIALEEQATSQELMETSQQWLTEFTREIERIADGADPSTFGEGLMLSRFDFEGAPREETIQLAAVAQSAANAIAALLRSVGEARARAGEAEGRLAAIAAFVERQLPESDPRRAALEEMLGETSRSIDEAAGGGDRAND